jgi:UDP-N-acetyl-2-amino-2-deoxyglucuronate dehydrogenase
LPSSDFRIGIVGLGLVAKEHIEAYQKMPEVKIVSICDVDTAATAGWQAVLGAAAFNDYRDLIAHGGIDLLLVLTPASTHRVIVEAAADAGLAIFCEKPLAVTLADGEAMVASCAKRGVKLFYGSIYRYLPAVYTAKRLIDEGAIGTIQLMSEQMIGGNGAQRYRQLNPVHYPSGGPGGSGMGLVDHGIHLIDVFAWFAGTAPVAVAGSGQISGAPLQSEHMVMQYPGGAVGHLLYNAGTFSTFLPNEGMFSGGMSWLTDGSLAPPGAWLAEPGSIAIYGTTGSLRIFHFANALFLNQGQGMKRVTLEGRPCPDHFSTQLEDCIDAIRTDRQPSIGGADALRALRALEAVYR